MIGLFDFMPEGASTWSDRVDWINNVITDISIFCIVAITAVMLYFAVKYKRKDSTDPANPITHNTLLETVWTVIPTIVVIYMFYFGFVTYKEMRTPPSNAMEILVEGQKWSWTFKHPNGKIDGNNLVVPIGQPVKLIMKSKDVLHSFFVPAFRIKEDLRPDSYSYAWFEATKTGDFHVFCAEYCGTQHSGMIANLKVVTSEEYQDYINDRSLAALAPEDLGKKLYTERGCNACHSLDGSKLIGPSFKDIFKNKSRTFADGSSTTAIDENYIRESILNPSAKVVSGYPAGLMPSFQGQLSDDEVAGIISYLKTL